mmetsp:Transcript_62405/g.110011  ORF Transcript_62405/g.110011 Transcript_62405/m.110011 type:complete len:290 (-) Transcript_62405:238-1107(-)
MCWSETSMFSFAARRPSCVGLNQKHSLLSRNTSPALMCCKYHMLLQILRMPTSLTRCKPFILSFVTAVQTSDRAQIPMSVISLHKEISKLVNVDALPLVFRALTMLLKDSSSMNTLLISSVFNNALLRHSAAILTLLMFTHLLKLICCNVLHFCANSANPSSEIRSKPSKDRTVSLAKSVRTFFNPRSSICAQWFRESTFRLFMRSKCDNEVLVILMQLVRSKPSEIGRFWDSTRTSSSVTSMSVMPDSRKISANRTILRFLSSMAILTMLMISGADVNSGRNRKSSSP